jgi:hypothetical protein
VASIVDALCEALAQRGIDGSRLNPWYFPGAEEYAQRLEAQGFAVQSIALIPRPTPLPTGADGWFETFAGSFAAALPGPERAGFFAQVRETLRPRLCAAGGVWTADYVRLRFRARCSGG